MTAPRTGSAHRTVACVGAGPAGLLAATQIKRARPDWHVVVHERSPKDVTYGYGVVFSDVAVRTIEFMTPSLGAVLSSQVTWQDVEVRAHGRRHRSSGHGYVALSRQQLLSELAGQALHAGVELRYESPAEIDGLRSRYDLVVAADGAHSRTRTAFATDLGARIGYGRSRFAWLGTTAAFDAMTFIFEETAAGPVVAHGYPHGDGISTFVVEVPCGGGGPREDLEQDLGHWSRVFAEHLDHRPLQAKELRWAHFPTVHLDRCVHENVVLIGDAAHTAHYSVGSGTRLALEDAFLLGQALGRDDDIGTALAEYERRRLPGVRELRAAGERSMRWFERAPEYLARPTPQFAVHLLSRTSPTGLERVEADAPDLVEQATRLLAGDAPPSAGVLSLPLEVGATRLPGRLVLDLTAGPPGPEEQEERTYGCVLGAADDPADPGPASRDLPRGVVVAAEDVILGGRPHASAPLVVIDMGPCPRDPERAAAEAGAFAEAARAAGWPAGPAVAVRTGFADAAEAALARLRVLRAAGLCDLADLAAPFGGAAEPDTVLDALEAADTVRTALGVPVMLSGFRARPDQVATQVLAGRIDAWCVPGPQ
ncbi:MULTISPECIES: FAD-dependent monooxygenase [unclassified Streptomyces]|uniref:FAD-dependent monooxygenase n=1 Tax=unclassified Streptomyces TaxID=2593676 RepID=UPI0037B77798